MDRKYTENLIKGKITEVIFEEMFRTSEEFTIIPLGYEHTTPILAQYQHHLQIQKVLENIRNAPDFVLLSQDKEKAFLVEVKYRSEFTKEDILEIAKNTLKEWNPSYLFIASKDSFYFSPCNWITNHNGEIENLSENWIPIGVQNMHIKLLTEFIR